jgi:uncharacterized phage-associated protein
MMYSVKAIANYFIDKGKDGDDPLTPMKLLKLVYIAHGWYLAHTDNPLFEDRVEAWKYGPVIPTLYHEFKHYGHEPIQTYAQEPASLHTTHKESSKSEGFADIEQFLDAVWDEYEVHDAIYLSSLTHLSGTPWDIANKEGDSVIKNEAIRDYYRKKMEANGDGEN